MRNVLGALPKSVHVGARRALHEIIGAEDRAHAEQAIGALVSDYGAKWPKAVAKVVDDAEALLCFFDFPAEHWPKLRSTDERFKARAHCRPEGAGLACSAGVVDPGAKSRAVGLGALPRSLPLEGPNVAAPVVAATPLALGHWGLAAGRFGCQLATSWR